MTRRIYKVKSRAVSSSGTPHAITGTFVITDDSLQAEVETQEPFRYHVLLEKVAAGKDHFIGIYSHTIDSRNRPGYYPAVHFDLVVDEGNRTFKGLWIKNHGYAQDWQGELDE